MVLGQRWDIFPPAIWCATKDSGEPKSHLIHTVPHMTNLTSKIYLKIAIASFLLMACLSISQYCGCMGSMGGGGRVYMEAPVCDK